MKYMSLFSGIEAASVAWQSLGWEPVAFSEIEDFPNAVLVHHYPNTPNLGDITKIDWNKHADCLTADLVVGGSPCQSFSIAGKREGLAGASGLMWEYVRAIQAIRPRWLVWENVPGALSSSGGEDFRCLLKALDGLGYGLAWRILDAQFFGVAQRRRRVFLVGSLGSTRSAEVLFEPESLRWHHPTSPAKRQALASQAQGSLGGADDGVCCLTPWDTQSRRVYRSDGAWPTLDARVRSGGDGRAVAFMSPALSTTKQSAISGDSTVRRLMPVECERLQGFPDGWTDVPYKGKDHAPDSPRYKALGNSMAVPVMRWIGRRIQKAEEDMRWLSNIVVRNDDQTP